MIPKIWTDWILLSFGRFFIPTQRYKFEIKQPIWSKTRNDWLFILTRNKVFSGGGGEKRFSQAEARKKFSQSLFQFVAWTSFEINDRLIKGRRTFLTRNFKFSPSLFQFRPPQGYPTRNFQVFLRQKGVLLWSRSSHQRQSYWGVVVVTNVANVLGVVWREFSDQSLGNLTEVLPWRYVPLN